jgi:outer membrane receptor protein involved in Fe transport
VDGCNFRRRNASTWVGVEEQLDIDWKLDGRFVTTVGGDLRFRYGAARPADYTDYVTGDGPFTVRLPYWQSKSVIGALFAQQVLRLHERVAANVGARFDADSLFGVRLSPRAALIFSPTDRSTLRVGYSEAFRAPSAQELNDSDPTYVIQPDRLNAETVRTADVEFAQRFSRGSFSLRAFGSIYEDLLVLRYATQAEVDEALLRDQLVPNVDPDGISCGPTATSSVLSAGRSPRAAS